MDRALKRGSFLHDSFAVKIATSEKLEKVREQMKQLTRIRVYRHGQAKFESRPWEVRQLFKIQSETSKGNDVIFSGTMVCNNPAGDKEEVPGTTTFKSDEFVCAREVTERSKWAIRSPPDRISGFVYCEGQTSQRSSWKITEKDGPDLYHCDVIRQRCCFTSSNIKVKILPEPRAINDMRPADDQASQDCPAALTGTITTHQYTLTVPGDLEVEKKALLIGLVYCIDSYHDG